jgi:hypothetical protein
MRLLRVDELVSILDSSYFFEISFKDLSYSSIVFQSGDIVLVNHEAQRKIMNNPCELTIRIDLGPIDPPNRCQSLFFVVLGHPNCLLQFIAKIVAVGKSLQIT